MPHVITYTSMRPKKGEPRPHLESFSSEQLQPRRGEKSGKARNRAEARAQLRQIVPSAPWYVQTIHDAGVTFPVPGMVRSESKTRFPADEEEWGADERGGLAGQRYFPAQSITYEDGLDAMSVRRAAFYRAPPAWSGQLVARIRPRYDKTDDIADDVTVTRAVRLAAMPRRMKPVGEGPRARRHFVYVRHPELQDTDPQGEKPVWRPTGRRVDSTEPLTELWPIDEVHVIRSRLVEV